MKGKLLGLSGLGFRGNSTILENYMENGNEMNSGIA